MSTQREAGAGRSAEMYLKTVYELESHEPVAISQVAERLEVSAVSATEMVKRLAEHGFLLHIPYRGVTLTATGQRQALKVIRRHRLWEYFLVNHLGLPWESVHDLACRLEHATDEEITEALAQYLGHPTTCPHGNPIPSADGMVETREVAPLSSLIIGERGRVVRIIQEEATLLDYLAQHGVFPNQVVEVEDIAPLDGPLTVRIGETLHVLGRKVSDLVLVEAISEQCCDNEDPQASE